MVISLQVVVAFQDFAQLGQRPMRVIGFVDGVAGRVNLVDGDVDVRVVGVVMNRTDPLVLAVTQPGADAFLDGLERGRHSAARRPES